MVLRKIIRKYGGSGYSSRCARLLASGGLVLFLVFAGGCGKKAEQSITTTPEIVEVVEITNSAGADSGTNTGSGAGANAGADGDLIGLDAELLRSGDFVASAKSIEITGDGISLNMDLVSKLKEGVLAFSIDDVSINGLMVDTTSWLHQVESGKSIQPSVLWTNYSLAGQGIMFPEVIEFTLTVYEKSSPHIKLETKTVKVDIPNKNKKTATRTISRSVSFVSHSFLDEKAENGGAVLAEAIDYIPSGKFGPYFLVLLNNSSVKKMDFSFESKGLNGIEDNHWWRFSVSPGKKAYVKLQWDSKKLKAMGISKIEQADIVFKVTSSEDLTENIYEPDLHEVTTGKKSGN